MRSARFFLCAIGLLAAVSGASAQYDDVVLICPVQKYANLSIATVAGRTVIGSETGPSDKVWVIGARHVHMEDLGIVIPCKFSKSLIKCTDPAQPSLNFTYYPHVNAFVVQGYWQGGDPGEEEFYLFAGTCRSGSE